MCLILDANVGLNTACNPKCEDKLSLAIQKRNNKGKCNIAFGGSRLATEYSASPNFMLWLRERLRAGRVTVYDHAQVDHKAEAFERDARCRSDDYHILALAEISGATLLWSRDQSLHADFKNPDLLEQPRQIVQAPSHSRLLNRAPACRRPQQQR